MAEGSEEQLDLVEPTEGDGDNTPKPEEVESKVELAALREKLQEQVERTARLEGEIQATRTAPSTPAPAAEPVPKQFTRAELRQMVDQGTITEDEMLDRIEAQRDLRLTQHLEKTMTEKLAANQQETTLAQQFASYREVVEGLDTPSHPNRVRAEKEYKELLVSGLPEGDSTQIAALKIAFGSPTKIRETTRDKRETHGESGGSSASGENKPGEQWTKGLKQPRIDYLKRQLEIGAYKNTDDPQFKDYIKYARAGAVH